MTETWTEIIDLFSAALTPIIALIVAYIAWRQHKTDKDKLRLHLYEKRFKVYQSIMELLASISKKADVSFEEVSQFVFKTNESKFLFENEIPDYIENVRTNAIKLHYSEQKFRASTSIDEDKKKTIAIESNDLLNWFGDQFKATNDLFMKYLSFKKI